MRTNLMTTPEMAVAVRRYRPGETHAPHRDAHSRVSFVLRGGYREEGPSGTLRMGAADVLLKSNNALHEDVFGDEGCTVLGLEFFDGGPFPQGPLWRKRDDATGLRQALVFLEAALARDAPSIGAAGNDLVTTAEDDQARETAPVWLLQLEDDLRQASLAAVDAGARAREAGVHPAHLSRLFRRCFGRSLTEHALTQSVRRAAAQLSCTELGLGEIALAAGFYDQSHMNRVFRRLLGRTPGQHRALLARAAG